jgi:hypothetical protein
MWAIGIERERVEESVGEGEPAARARGKVFPSNHLLD